MFSASCASQQRLSVPQAMADLEVMVPEAILEEQTQRALTYARCTLQGSKTTAFLSWSDTHTSSMREEHALKC